MTIEFERVPLEDVPFDELDTFADRTVHQTPEWLAFLAETQRAEPVVLRLRRKREEVGWFTGAITRRAGVRILGSPKRGWMTSHMGFNLVDDRDIGEATRTLADHAFGELRCWHVEVMDRRNVGASGRPEGFSSTPLHTLEIALVGDDELLAAMSSHGRRDVRKSLRTGVLIEEVDGDDPTFVEEYQRLATTVFAKRRRRPPHSAARVGALVGHLHPAGRLLLLRARTPSGDVAAAGLFAGLPGGAAYFTLQASEPDQHRWYPNEAMVWEAMRRWRDRGAVRFDLGGRQPGSPTDFKRKFGGEAVTTEWLRRSRVGALEHARSVAAGAHRTFQSRPRLRPR